MSIPTVDGWDSTGGNLSQAPKTGQAAGYITGIPPVPWSAIQMAEYPGFVQIDQSPDINTIDDLADFYDVENGAVTVDEIAELVLDGQAGFKAAIRPGQRWPGVYCSRSQVTEICNALLAGGVMSCSLGIADYNFDHGQAQNEVANTSGPFPVVWRQYSDQGGGGAYDLDVFSVPWLNNVSVAPIPPIVKDYDMVILSVIGDPTSTWAGKTRTFTYNGPVSVAPEHIVSQEDQAAFAKELPVIPVSWAQYVGFGGQ
jgi:hypothetical protein